MWAKNSTNSKWYKREDRLDKNKYNKLREDLKDTLYYGKCFDGTTYTSINDTNDIYSQIKYKDLRSWTIVSPYNLVNKRIDGSITNDVDAGNCFTYNEEIQTGDRIINDLSIYDQWYKYNVENAFTIKNKFTPYKTIEDMLRNFVLVDLASVDNIDSLTSPKPVLKIDGVRVIDGHRVLVKDQKTFVTLDRTVNPNVYFSGNYYITSEDFGTISYYYYNNLNGIYEYQEDRLVKTDDLTDYYDSYNYSVSVKLGLENREKQFHLSRLLNGEYPLTSETDPIEFVENKNWLLRNHTEYQNILDLNISFSKKFEKEEIEGYLVEERTIFVGEFGSIIILQGGEMHNILNDYKYDLKSLSSNEKYYFVVGERGKILKIDKITLNVEFIDTKSLHTFNSIDFYNDNIGITVGEQNSIYYTNNGGDRWERYLNEDFENIDMNKVLFTNLNEAFIVGDNGTIIIFEYIEGNWTSNKIIATKVESIDDSFKIVEHIYDIKKFNSIWSGVTEQDNDKLVFVGGNSLIGFYNINDDFLWSFIDIKNLNLSDIKSIEVVGTDLYIVSDFLYKIDLTKALLDEYPLSEYNNIFYFDEEVNIGSIAIIEEIEYNNSSFDIGDEGIILVGDDLKINKYELSSSTTTDIITQNYRNNIKSRMMFMDYDTAAKLNWFGDNEVYRLPNDGILEGMDTNSIISLDSYSGELNWVDYDKDCIKTYRYGSNLDDSSKVEYNTTFYGNSPFNEVILSTFTNDLSDIEPLLSVNQPSNIYDLYMYDNISVVKVSGLNVIEGDVIFFDSNEVSSEFIVNRIISFGGNTYAYIYTNFNEEMTNNIVKGQFPITITNLNRFSTLSEFMKNFNRHKLGYGYKVVYKGDYVIKPLFNDKTAYYNMQCEVTDVQNSVVYDMLYEELFVDFGYTANYSILSYLNNINPSKFTEDKVFYSMPSYKDFTFNNNNVVINSNKLSFNPSLKFEWDTFWLNTFIDIEYNGVKTGKYLIIDKYYDEDIDRYILSLHKELEYSDTMTKFNILSRRSLKEISEDLNELNNIQRNYNDENQITSYKREIISKFNTDSYTRIMISDGDIKDEVTAILYTDDKNQYAMNLINLPKVYDFDIVKISSYPEDRDDGVYKDKVKVIREKEHNLKLGDYVMMNTDTYKGLASVKKIFSPTQFGIDMDYSNQTLDNEKGNYLFYKFDPSLNYSALDVIDVGTDAKTKISKMIRPDKVNSDYINGVISIDISDSEYRFNLIDGLYLEYVALNYPWILEAEIEDALIGKDENGDIVWYKGIWECGRWFSGTWYSGTWLCGEWYAGNWYSNKVTFNQISAKVDKNIKDDQYSRWFGGNFRGGEWFNGSWYDGRHVDGNWYNGDWFDGRWDYGEWFQGRFMSGVWIDGTWYNGFMNCDHGLSIWVNGEWQGGDFECGIWKDGNFSNKSNPSRFGTSPFNSRKALWESGKWYNGEFHSIVNYDEDNNPIYSLNNKYSIFETGIWFNGEWFGGTSYSMDYQNGKWCNGVVKDIKVDSINDEDKIIKVEGIFNFNNLDEIFVIRNNNDIDEVGNDKKYGKYIVKKIEFEYDIYNNPFTNIYIFNDIVEETPLAEYRIVSKFKDIKWENGVLFNGIFESGVWENGIFINGTFIDGEWV